MATAFMRTTGSGHAIDGITSAHRGLTLGPVREEHEDRQHGHELIGSEDHIMGLKQRAAAVAFFDLVAHKSDWDAIVNGGSKVGLVVPDGSFRNPPDLGAAKQRFQNCQRQGQLVLGYVFTGIGDRDVGQVNTEIDQWAGNYGEAIDGFYFDSGIELDLGKTDQQFQDYYRPLMAGLRTKYPCRKVGLAASQYKYDWVIDVADFATIWEGSAADYLDVTKYLAIGEQHLEPPPGWWSINPARVIVTVVQTPQNQVGQVLAVSQNRNAGNLYIFDSTTSNYGHLSQWWNSELTGLAGWTSNWIPRYQQGDPGAGIGGYDLKSAADRVFAFDYDGACKLDHLALYRPGTGTIWILKNTGGTWSPVYQQGDPGTGIGGYDLRSAADRVFAFDYDSSGKLDHLALYRPGTGTIWILKNTGGTWSPVYRQGDPGTGIGGYDLRSAADRVFALNYHSYGHIDHLVLFRPGTGTIWILDKE